MKTTILTIALVLGSTGWLYADSTPQIVVLDNENLMEGKVSLVDGRYVIQMATSEISLPRTRVLAVVKSREEAFDVVAQRANRGDADERLRLARWCLANKLYDLALREAEAATKMRPGFTTAQQFVRAAESLKANAAKIDPQVTPAKAETDKTEKAVDIPTIEYNSESFPLYAARVNTILMNMCATCHAGDDVTKFRLVRTPGRAGVGKNMMSALAQINPKDPLASPLLTKAVAPHGTATEPPMKTRNHPAYQTLETWVRFARATEGTLEPDPLPAATVVSTEPMKLPSLDAPKTQPPVTTPSDVPKPTEPTFGADSKTPPPPKEEKLDPSDPFDPAQFNKQRPSRDK